MKPASSSEVVSKPFNVHHNCHVYIDPTTKQVVGLPRMWGGALDLRGLHIEEPKSSKSETKQNVSPEIAQPKGDYVNAISRQVKKVSSCDEILDEIRNICYHNNPNEYEKYVVGEVLGEGASGETC